MGRSASIFSVPSAFSAEQDQKRNRKYRKRAAIMTMKTDVPPAVSFPRKASIA